MKPVEKLALLLIAILALLALTAAPSSADALCKINETPCAAGNTYPVGTKFESSLTEGKFHFAGKLHSVDCTASTMSAELTALAKPSAPGSPFLGEIISEEFKNCTSPTAGPCQTFKTKSIAAPIKFFASTKTPGDGLVETFAGAKEIEMACTGLSCTWEYLALEEFPYVRTFTGGKPPTESIKVTYVRQSGSPFCGTTFVAEGKRQLSSPTPGFWVR